MSATIPEAELGLDLDGYRQEAQIVGSSTTAYGWKWTTPDNPKTLPHDSATAAGSAPPDQLTIMATKSPVDAPVEFTVAGDDPCVTLVATEDLGNGSVKLKIRATKASTPVNGARKANETLLRATHDGKVICDSNVYVIKPARIKTKPAGTVESNVVSLAKSSWVFHAEYEGQPVATFLTKGQIPPALLGPYYGYQQVLKIEILDQYDKPLGAMYSGTKVKENTSWIAWMGGSGTYDDPVGRAHPTQTQNLNTSAPVPSGDLNISIAGHSVGKFARTISISNDNGSTADYQVQWA